MDINLCLLLFLLMDISWKFYVSPKKYDRVIFGFSANVFFLPNAVKNGLYNR